MSYCDKLVFKDRILSKNKIDILRQKGVKIKLPPDSKVEVVDDINLVDNKGKDLYPIATLYDGTYYILQGKVAPTKDVIFISKVVLKTMLYNPADMRN